MAEQFVVKMIREKEDLEGKIRHLSKALESDNSRISAKEKELMESQRNHMIGYLHDLEKRISLHNN